MQSATGVFGIGFILVFAMLVMISADGRKKKQEEMWKPVRRTAQHPVFAGAEARPV
ncbi:MAG: hypothetical protein SOH80_08250 [Eubacteriales bacterium]